MSEQSCGPNADDRYCPAFWNLTNEFEEFRGQANDEIERLHDVVRELLEATGLDDDEQAEWLARAGIPGEEVPDGDS